MAAKCSRKPKAPDQPTGGHKPTKPDPREVAIKARADLRERLRAECEWEYVQKLEQCERPLVLVCTECGTTKEVESGCGRRWCPVCARKISAERSARFREAVRRMECPLFVTLTIENTTAAREGLDTIRAAYGRFRRQAWFLRCNVRGGITTLEVTNKGAGWHPHLHSIIDCDWLAPSRLKPQIGDTKRVIEAKCAQSQAELSVQWAAAVKQPTAIVWVKKTDEGAANEVLKYVVKPSDLIESPDNPGDLIRAIEGTRLLTTFGSCYGLAGDLKREAEANKQPCLCEKCNVSAWMPAEVAARIRPAQTTAISSHNPEVMRYAQYLRSRGVAVIDHDN